jgi:hypothetical protein
MLVGYLRPQFDRFGVIGEGMLTVLQCVIGISPVIIIVAILGVQRNELIIISEGIGIIGQVVISISSTEQGIAMRLVNT